MAFLKYRGNTTTPGVWSFNDPSNAPLSNLDIDKNFASLDAQKLDISGGTLNGTLTIGTFGDIAGNIRDGSLFIVDDSDTSKRLQFQISGVTSGQTRVLSAPDTSGTIALTSDLTLQKITNNGSSTSNVISFTNNTDAVSTSTGAVTITGGLGVAKNLHVGGNLVLNGNLTVSGTTTAINTETLTINDNIIVLNRNATDIPTENAGIEVYRGDSSAAAILWNEGTDRWQFTNNGSTYYNLPTTGDRWSFSNYKLYTAGGAGVSKTSNETVTATESNSELKVLGSSHIAIYGDNVNKAITFEHTDYGVGYTPSSLTLNNVPSSDVGQRQQIITSINYTRDQKGHVQFSTPTLDNVKIRYYDYDTDRNIYGDPLTSPIAIVNTGASGSKLFPEQGGLASELWTHTSVTITASTGTINATNFNSTSDIRYKTDLEKIGGALNKVKQLTGYTFRMIGAEQLSTGLIAQDVQRVLPEAVTSIKVEDEEKLTVSYGNMMGLIVEAIKDLDDKLTSIQKQLENK